ncbi:hypothetical protein ACOHYD_12205 [Desulfobacterota bacterium M19]
MRRDDHKSRLIGPVSIVCFLALVTLSLLEPALAGAAEWKLVPDLGIKEEYNDNVLFVENPAGGEMITTLDGRLTAFRRTARSSVKMSGSLAAVRHAKSSYLDAWDQNYSLSLNRRMTERLQMGISTSVARDSRADRYLDEGGLVTDISNRWLEQVQLSSNYVWSEKTSSSFSYAFSNQHYQGRAQGASRSQEITVGTMFHPLWKPANSSVFTELKLGINDFSTSKVDEYSMALGYGYSVNELWRLTLGGGMQYSRTTMEGRNVWFRLDTTPTPHFVAVASIPVENSWSDIGWLTRIILDYHGERMKGSMRLSHDYYPASDYASLAVRDRVSLKADHRLNKKISVSLSGEYVHTRSVGGGLDSRVLNTIIWRLKPRFSYTPSKDVSLRVVYAYTSNLNRLTGIKEVQNRVNIAFNFNMNVLK